MSSLNALLESVSIPPVYRVKQRFSSTVVENVESTLWLQLTHLAPRINVGDRIAITCGSRGLNRYSNIVRTVVRYIVERGGQPFLVPAMGSHGGATVEGQRELLAKLGITEESIGVPILASMDTVQVGTADNGLPINIDRYAAGADGIVLLNRIKPHTSFRGTYESGLVKMMAVGLANQRGAEMTHSLGYENMAANIATIGRGALRQLNILCGVATLENGYGNVAELHVIPPQEIFEREPALLERAFCLMPRIYLDEIDALIVGEIGKDISGTGMDTNIVGRFHTKAASGGPKTIKLGLLDLSGRSSGNANGMGLADFVTRKLYQKIDFESTYVNSLTSTEPNSTKLPMVLDNDRLVVQACLKVCGQLDTYGSRMVLIQNTKALDQVYMTRAAIEALCAGADVEVDEQGKALSFDALGNLLLF